jgi:hypothetical protein
MKKETEWCFLPSVCRLVFVSGFVSFDLSQFQNKKKQLFFLKV